MYARRMSLASDTQNVCCTLFAISAQQKASVYTFRLYYVKEWLIRPQNDESMAKKNAISKSNFVARRFVQ